MNCRARAHDDHISDTVVVGEGRVATQYCRELDLPATLLAPIYRLHFLYKARVKAETTSLDNSVPQAWLELFADSPEPARTIG